MIRNKLTSGQIYLSLTMLRDQEGSTISIRTSHMDQNLENRIRERAYEIWAADGYVHDQADQHWLTAEREILAASTVAPVREPAPQKKRRSPARSKTTKTLAVASYPRTSHAEIRRRFPGRARPSQAEADCRRDR
jgi:hypothetical protein